MVTGKVKLPSVNLSTSPLMLMLLTESVTLLILAWFFNNKEKLDALNALVHPKVKDHFKNFIDKENTKFILYEAAILFETGSNSLCDYIIAVTANFEDKIKRVMLRDEVSKKQVMERMKNQLKDNFKIRNADFVIRNGSLEHTKLQVATIFDLIVKLNI